MNTYSSWLGQKGNRLVHSVKYKNIRTFSCLRQQMFFCSIRRRRRRQRQRRQREQQKTNRFILAKQQLCTCITHVHHAFPSLHDYDVKLPNFTFCRGREHKTTTFFFFSWTLKQSLQFNSREIYQHLTHWTGWNKRDKVWSSANSLRERRKSSLLFKWRYRGRRHGCCLT